MPGEFEILIAALTYLDYEVAWIEVAADPWSHATNPPEVRAGPRKYQCIKL